MQPNSHAHIIQIMQSTPAEKFFNNRNLSHYALQFCDTKTHARLAAVNHAFNKTVSTVNMSVMQVFPKGRPHNVNARGENTALLTFGSYSSLRFIRKNGQIPEH